jgi:hypothetical protein
MATDVNVVSAEKILSMSEDRQIRKLVTEMIKNRALSSCVIKLNSDVLSGEEPNRSMAIAALGRMGLWTE